MCNGPLCFGGVGEGSKATCSGRPSKQTGVVERQFESAMISGDDQPFKLFRSLGRWYRCCLGEGREHALGEELGPARRACLPRPKIVSPEVICSLPREAEVRLILHSQEEGGT